MALLDCTHPIADGMQTYPGDPPVRTSPHATHAADGHRVTALELGSHTGTHVDAPSHTEPAGETLGELPVERFRLDARLVDATDVPARSPVPPTVVPAVGAGREPSPGADTDGERDVGDPSAPDLLVVRTGWDEHWGTPRYRDHPYLAPETARLCARRGFDVAMDTLSPDPTPAPGPETATSEPGVPAHHALLGAGRLVLENLRGLDRLPERFVLRAYPLAIDGDGAPVRAVASVPEDRA